MCACCRSKEVICRPHAFPTWQCINPPPPCKWGLDTHTVISESNIHNPGGLSVDQWGKWFMATEGKTFHYKVWSNDSFRPQTLSAPRSAWSITETLAGREWGYVFEEHNHKVQPQDARQNKLNPQTMVSKRLCDSVNKTITWAKSVYLRLDCCIWW